MLKLLGSEAIPRTLHGPVLVSAQHVPRYWATVWSLLDNAGLAESTQIAKLRAVDDLYEHYDARHKPGALDLALSRMDDSALAEALEAWFVTLSNQPRVTQTSELRWKAGVAFITTIYQWLSGGSADNSAAITQARARWTHLAQLYRNLCVPKPKRSGHIRALPARVVETLYGILDPGSVSNPFDRPRTKWNVYVAFVLFLHQGLRRGELLHLTADAVKERFDARKQERRSWLSVRFNPYEESYQDPRYSKPSIKTQDSIRSLPVSTKLAALIDTYTNNFRGKPNHSFLLNSHRDLPLSTEALTKAFARATSALPDDIRQELTDTIGKASVTPHDLRHTAAVIRLNQMLASGDQMDEALQKLRVFFGWSRTSLMPTLYARALFQDRLATVWTDAFDDRVELIRNADLGKAK